MTIRILIIDNEQRWINFVKKALDDVEIIVAPNDIVAVKMLKKNQFDLILVSAGYLYIVKAITEKYTNKRAIVTTINPNTEEALSAFRLGALRYLPKSFGSTELLNYVREALPSV